MKTKDWIKELQKLDPEKELYIEYDRDAYVLFTPQVKVKKLREWYAMKKRFISEDNGLDTSIGECNVIKLDWW